VKICYYNKNVIDCNTVYYDKICVSVCGLNVTYHVYTYDLLIFMIVFAFIY